MKNILIPTDFSQNAWNALKYGLDLFQHTKCTFYLTHVNPVPGYSGARTSLTRTSEKLADTLLEKSMKSLKELIVQIENLTSNPNHTFVPLAFYSNFTSTIKGVVKNKDIEFIVMGTKGATGLKKVTVGSNTANVMAKVECPILAVPENAKYADLNEIAFPTDYKISYDIKVLDTLIEMVTMNKAKLRILNVARREDTLNAEQQKNKDFLGDYLVDVDHSFHTLTNIKLETAVQAFTESRDIDMIAMVAKDLNFFQRVLFRPKVDEISYHTKVPFLVLHE